MLLPVRSEKKATIFFMSLFLIIYPILEGVSNQYIPIGTKYLGFALAFIWLLDTLFLPKLRFNGKSIALLLLVIWSISSLSWTVSEYMSNTRVMGYVQVFILYFILVDITKTRETLVRLMKSYVVGLSFLALSSVVNIVSGADARWHDRFSAMGQDPNYFGIMAASSIPIACFLYTERKSKLSLLYILFVVPMVIATASRGAILALAIVALGYMFMALKSVKKMVGLALVLSVLWFLVPYIVPESAILRLTESASDTTGSGRTQIWDEAWRLGMNAPFLGNGAGSFMYLSDGSKMAHNTFLSHWADLGMVGLGLWTWLWMTHFKKIILIKLPQQDKTLKKALLLTLGTILVGALTLNWEIQKAVFIVWGFISALDPTMVKEPQAIPLVEKSRKTFLGIRYATH